MVCDHNTEMPKVLNSNFNINTIVKPWYDKKVCNIQVKFINPTMNKNRRLCY